MSNPARSRTSLATTSVRRRYTKQQIETRRNGIWEMLCCGSSIDEMASKFGVSDKTVRRDVEWWMARLGRDADSLKDPEIAARDIGMTAAFLKQMAHDAYVEFITQPNALVKARFLETAGRMMSQRHKLLADAGHLPKVGHEREEEHSVKISFEARFGKDAPQAIFDDDRARRRVMEAVFANLGAGITAVGDTAQAPAALTLDVQHSELPPA